MIIRFASYEDSESDRTHTIQEVTRLLEQAINTPKVGTVRQSMLIIRLGGFTSSPSIKNRHQSMTRNFFLYSLAGASCYFASQSPRTGTQSFLSLIFFLVQSLNLLLLTSRGTRNKLLLQVLGHLCLALFTLGFFHLLLVLLLFILVLKFTTSRGTLFKSTLVTRLSAG